MAQYTQKERQNGKPRNHAGYSCYSNNIWRVHCIVLQDFVTFRS